MSEKKEENTQEEATQCDHKPNTNPLIAQSVIGLGSKLLVIISSRCPQCNEIATTFTEVPVGSSSIATVKPNFT